MLGEPTRDRRAERREATKVEILDAAWAIAREEGLAALSLRDVARRVGMQAPSLYGYFDSKMAIYDAMYAQGAQQFVDAERWDEMTGDARHDIRLIIHTVVEFCTADTARYQLLFQRTIPGFEPSPEAFAVSVDELDRLAAHLATCGLTEPGDIDLFTALGTGLTDQQISNDPGGDRWIRLIDDAVDMFVDHIEKRNAARTVRSTRTARSTRTRRKAG
ncbi:MAG TPA: TetR/AcrR family transcriptional regulator [Acidimicrobiales bacterium]